MKTKRVALKMGKFKLSGVGTLGVVGVLGLAGIAAMPGCTGMTAEDYIAQKAHQDFAKYQAISGSYNGTAYSAKDHSPFGALTVTLSPNEGVNPTSASADVQSQVSLQGSVTLETTDGNSHLLQFKGGYYDYVSGDFLADATIPVSSTSASGGGISASGNTVVEVSGTISNGTLTGQINAEGFDQLGIQFTLRKNGPLPAAETLSGGKALPSPAGTANGTYEAKVPLCSNAVSGASCDPQTIRLVFLNPVLTADQDFADLFEPVKTIAVGLYEADNSQVGVTFSVASLDTRTGKLRGTAISQSTPSYYLRLECTQISGNQGDGDWNCSYTIINGSPIFADVIFTPVKGGAPR